MPLSPLFARTLPLWSLLFLHSFAESHANDEISSAEARLLGDIQYLASDELQGRAAETPGLVLGAEFIAKRFSDLGLKTDLFDGKPFQEFQLDGGVGTPANKNSLAITNAKGERLVLKLAEDYQPQSFGRNGEFSGGIVFVGYGITATGDIQYDDYANIDVAGKVVIAIRKEPQADDPDSKFDGREPSQHALFTTKVMNAVKHGAAAVIVVNDASTEKASPKSLMPISSAAGVLRNQVPAVFLQRSILQDWLKDVGKSLSDIEEGIDRDLTPRSFVLDGWKAEGQVTIERMKLPSLNVLGLLPGRGKLAEEYVVIGAHFDHVGMGGAGSLAPGTIAVHNGADDNASGTVSLLEAARRLVEKSKETPEGDRRNILFIAFSGEERGLLGSAYYCNHPRFELEKTVAMLNMDMVGRLTDNELTVYGTGTATEFDSMLDKANEKLAFKIQRQPEGLGPSDHQSFFLKNISVLHFFTGLHDDYHRPSDDFDKINLNGMERITDMVTILADRIATDPSRPTFVKVSGRANPQAAAVARRVRLGVRMNASGDGVVIERVLSDSVAQKAGVMAGDKLLKVQGVDVESQADVTGVMQKVKPGEELAIEVLRGTEKVELKVLLPK